MTTAERSERRVHSVSALLAGLNRLLEDRVGRLWIAGEISNLHEAASGHAYFSLKDPGGQVRAVCFRSDLRRLRFELEEGLEVVAYVEVSIYAPRGDLQCVVRQLEPRGAGALQLAFEQLRRRLEAEGLFAPEAKRELPAHPRRVGVVTSDRGAAIRDVMEVARQRFAGTPLLLAATRVQGEGAEREIAAALGRVVAVPGREDVDVVLLVRGGGSLEDLWCFNTEEVARAIAGCPVPVVTGVGHESDVTIADLAADLRAPTPSAAVAAVLPDRAAMVMRLERDERRLVAAVRARMAGARARLASRRDALRALAPTARLAARRERLEGLVARVARAAGLLVERRRGRLAAASGRLDSLSPLAVLGRGYALLRRERDGRIVRGAEEAPAGEKLRAQVAEADLELRVEAVRARSRT